MSDNQALSLRDLIQNSYTYQSLPAESQAIFLEKILALPEEGQKQVIDILLAERSEKERIDQEAASKLQQIAETYLPKLKELEQQFEKNVNQELEKTTKADEASQMDTLLADLEKE